MLLNIMVCLLVGICQYGRLRTATNRDYRVGVLETKYNFFNLVIPIVCETTARRAINTRSPLLANSSNTDGMCDGSLWKMRRAFYAD